MKKLICALFVILAVSCKPEPEFYINGVPYYTQTRCTNYKTESLYDYHFGFNYFTLKHEYHLGPHTETTCTSFVTDTIEISNEK